MCNLRIDFCRTRYASHKLLWHGFQGGWFAGIVDFLVTKIAILLYSFSNHTRLIHSEDRAALKSLNNDIGGTFV